MYGENGRFTRRQRTVGLKRLAKLADHLMRGKLGHKRFDFNFYNIGFQAEPPVPGCGTAGCAVGECPVVFPRQWSFGKRHEYGYPFLRSFPTFGALQAAAEFFRVSIYEAYHMFIPDTQHPEQFGGQHLPPTATRKEVARNIREFIKTAGYIKEVV